jgi:hypothetical protein
VPPSPGIDWQGYLDDVKSDQRVRSSCYLLSLCLREARDFAVPRTVVRLARELARRNPRLLSLLSLLALRFVAVAFLVLRAAIVLFFRSSLPSRLMACATRPGLRAFCAASAFAAIVPNVHPIDLATLIKSVPPLLRLIICVSLPCQRPFMFISTRSR